MMRPRIDPEGRNSTRPAVNFITINCGLKFSDKVKYDIFTGHLTFEPFITII